MSNPKLVSIIEDPNPETAEERALGDLSNLRTFERLLASFSALPAALSTAFAAPSTVSSAIASPVLAALQRLKC